MFVTNTNRDKGELCGIVSLADKPLFLNKFYVKNVRTHPHGLSSDTLLLLTNIDIDECNHKSYNFTGGECFYINYDIKQSGTHMKPNNLFWNTENYLTKIVQVPPREYRGIQVPPRGEVPPTNFQNLGPPWIYIISDF